MDISKLTVRDGHVVVMTIKDPRDPTGIRPLMDGEDKPMTISMIGMDSPKMREASRRFQGERILDKTVANIVNVSDAVVSLKEAERRNVELIATAVVNWSGLGIGEESSPCTFENVVHVLTELPWLFNQVNIFLDNRSNFIKASNED